MSWGVGKSQIGILIFNRKKLSPSITLVPLLLPSAMIALVEFVIMIRTSTPGRGTPTAPGKTHTGNCIEYNLFYYIFFYFGCFYAVKLLVYHVLIAM